MAQTFIEIEDGLLVNASAIAIIDGIDDNEVTVYLTNGSVHHLDEEHSDVIREYLMDVAEEEFYADIDEAAYEDIFYTSDDDEDEDDTQETTEEAIDDAVRELTQSYVHGLSELIPDLDGFTLEVTQ